MNKFNSDWPKIIQQMNHGNSRSIDTNERFILKSKEHMTPALAAQRTHAVFDLLGLIRPTADLLFKKLMTDSPDALLDLRNRILRPSRPFVELEFLDTEVAPDADGEKAIRLDLLVRSDDGAVVDIEIQSGGATEL